MTRFTSSSNDWFVRAEVRRNRSNGAGSSRMAGPVVEKPQKRPRKVSDAPVKKKTRRSKEGLLSKRESDKRRGQTRITIGIAFPRWRALKEEKGLRADTDVALLLLDSYEKYANGPSASTPIKAGGKPQPPPAPSLSSNGTQSQRGKQHQQDDVEHDSETTCMSSEQDWHQDSFEEMEVTIDEDDYNSVKNRLSDLDSDMENVVETSELSAPGADDSCDEDVYVPIIPQRSTTSELLLECKEEELEPWQEQTSHVHVKDEDDVGELSNDQTDCKPESSLLQRNAMNTSPPKLKTESPQHQGFILAIPQLTSNTDFTGSLGTQCSAGNSFTIAPGQSAQQTFFQKVTTPTIKTEACDIHHTSEVHQISNNPMSSSSVQCPAVYATPSNQLFSNQSNSQTLPVPFTLTDFTVIKHESPGTSNKQ